MISEFDPNEGDTDKQNPYHGMLTLTIQGKGVDSQTNSAPVRGPGRPPLNDISLDDLTEAEDPVKKIPTIFVFFSLETTFGNLI